ncbi:hypothetical protein [Pandoraea sp. SD6-2]|uniref:hypothetical protein n=1 Tax=Pandoraea sp. SD6-2 TaxID=1286093 RepID=UPI0003308D4C|nr:hypothetical protein [Pandoraea sp. SD6-2]EON13442.1 hypothetical protein C266_11315 [Pandoraea sp. SD6-2]
MKTYPLIIQDTRSDDTYSLMSKGHHDVHEFMRAARAEGYDWPLGMPRHTWVKTTPTRLAGYRCWFNEVEEGTRGAYPATFVHEAYGDERYEAMCAASQAAEERKS